ncbi:MAG TPA: hypothetical protein VIM75_13195 [Ohtaekwangia sp.]|uniref:hypothetical protein n=1 Tax=Ohtaekwangia sp. TaxID=2066019 RepID=UPI002F94B0D8
MKKQKIGLLVVYLLVVFVISCSDDETQERQRTLELRFPSLMNSNGLSTEGFESYTVMIESTSPLIITSTDLVAVNAINAETGELSSVITRKKDGLKDYATSRAEPSIRRGYMYDGNDCFVWGTIITASNGSVYFYPADSATQLLMNRCGYANVA